MPDFRGEFHFAGQWEPNNQTAADLPAKAIGSGLYAMPERAPFRYDTMTDEYIAAGMPATGNIPELYMRYRPMLYRGAHIGDQRASANTQIEPLSVTAPVRAARFGGDIYRGG